MSVIVMEEGKRRRGPRNESCRAKSEAEVMCFCTGVVGIAGHASVSCLHHRLHHHSYDRVVDCRLEL